MASCPDKLLFLRNISDTKSLNGYMRLNYMQYNCLLSDLKVVALKTKNKTQREYYILRKFEVFDCGRNEKLIMKRKPDSPILYVIPLEEIYNVIKKTHIETGHGGRDKMLHSLGKKYANITREMVDLYKSFCVACQ